MGTLRQFSRLAPLWAILYIATKLNLYQCKSDLPFPYITLPMASFYALNSNPKSSPCLTRKPYMLWLDMRQTWSVALLSLSGTSGARHSLNTRTCSLLRTCVSVLPATWKKLPQAQMPPNGDISLLESHPFRETLRASQRPYLKISFQSSPTPIPALLIELNTT